MDCGQDSTARQGHHHRWRMEVGATGTGWGAGGWCKKTVTYGSQRGCPGRGGQGWGCPSGCRGCPSWGHRPHPVLGLTSPAWALAPALTKPMSPASAHCPLAQPIPRALSSGRAWPPPKNFPGRKWQQAAVKRCFLLSPWLPPATLAHWPQQGEAASDWPRPTPPWSCHPGHNY